MATLLLPPTLNSHHSISTFQLRNSHFTSPLKIKPLRHSTPLVRASKKDSYSNSNPETQQDAEANNLGVKAALSMLRFYKREISPILPRSCRYIPTCSEYSMEAYKRYGVMKGTVLTAWRLCRCNPLGGYGYDPPRWFGEISQQEGEEVDD